MGFFDKIKQGLAKTRAAFSSTLEEVFDNAEAIDDDFFDEDVNENVLKMSDLSWDEAKLILLYRNAKNKDDIIKAIIEESEEDK